MSKLNSCYFHLIIQKYDKLNDKEISCRDLENVLKDLPSLVEYSFILHDKDKNTPHFHVNVILNTPHQADTLLYSLAGDLMINVKCITINAINNNAYYERQRYLTHIFEEGKYRYSADDVYSNNYENYNTCLLGVNPYEVSINGIYALCRCNERLIDVYRCLGLKNSNTYHKLIKDIRQSCLDDLEKGL